MFSMQGLDYNQMVILHKKGRLVKEIESSWEKQTGLPFPWIYSAEGKYIGKVDEHGEIRRV